jgi:hypothetical protein
LVQRCESSVALRAVLLLAVLLLSVASRPVRAQSLSTSLVNGSFESGSGSNIPGWTFSGAGSATIVVKSTTSTGPPVDTGNHAVLMTVPQPGTMYLGSNRVGVSPNLRYRFTARLKAASQNQQGALHAVEWGANNALLRDTTLALSSGLNANWETLRGYLVPLAGTQSVEIRLMPVLPQGGSAQLYWDSVDLTRGDATAWEPWETTLTSTLDYSPPVANPYKDLILTATFFRVATTVTTCPALPTSCTGPNCIQGYGFWDGVPGTASSRTFKARTLLPAGSWCWAVRCAGPAGQCSSLTTEPGLNTQSAAPVVVLANTTPANKLYALGMPRMSSNSRFLVYGDQTTTFPWIADTAWEAPVRYTPSQSAIPSNDLWRSFVWDRVRKNFTTLLVAPAAQYLQPPLPANVLGFRGLPNCSPLVTTVVPNECTYWDTPYWQKFDQMVRTANNAGLMIVVAGVMDPMDRSGTNTANLNEKFPNPDAAIVFARNFAARLASSYVIFSPGFDDRQYDLTVDGRHARDSMKAVGTALKVGGLPLLSPIAAVPRHLVVNHLSGGSALSDYDIFQNDPWLSFQMFQSGHGGSFVSASVQCPTGDATSYAICRARELALRFRCMGDPTIPSPPCSAPRATGNVKPATNAEAAYEEFTVGTAVDRTSGVRNTAYATALSGSFGVTLGVEGISRWDNPAIFSDNYVGTYTSHSDNDLAFLASLFRSAPWTDLTPRHNLILNNSTVDSQKMLLAGSSTYALLYAPYFDGNQSVSLSITASNALSGLSCDPSWTKFWINPRSTSSAPITAVCNPGQGRIFLSGVPSCIGPQCGDWVLKLTARGAAPPSPDGISSPTAPRFMVWSVEAPDGSTADIMGQLLDIDGNPLANPITVNSDGVTFGKLPTVTVDTTGNFLVAWQTEFPDGTLDAISIRWLDSNGGPISDTIQLPAGSDGQQAEPDVTSDPLGNVIIVWTAYSADGSISEIYRQDVLDGSVPPDMPMLVSDPSQLAASAPQVQVSAQGNSIVAWNGVDGTTGTTGVYYRRFNSHAKPIGPQRYVGRQASGQRRLVKLYVDSQGNYRIRSERFDLTGNRLGIFEQRFHSDGTEDGNETPVNPDP